MIVLYAGLGLVVDVGGGLLSRRLIERKLQAHRAGRRAAARMCRPGIWANSMRCFSASLRAGLKVDRGRWSKRCSWREGSCPAPEASIASRRAAPNTGSVYASVGRTPEASRRFRAGWERAKLGDIEVFSRLVDRLVDPAFATAEADVAG